MPYGLNARLFVENGPAITAARARRASSARLAAVRQLQRRPVANDNIEDGFPVAL